MADLRGLSRQSAGVVIADPRQSLGLRKRQRPEQQRVDHAEHRRAGADPEARYQDDKDGEPNITPKGPKRVAEILDEGVEGHAQL